MSGAYQPNNIHQDSQNKADNPRPLSPLDRTNVPPWAITPYLAGRGESFFILPLFLSLFTCFVAKYALSVYGPFPA